MSNTDFFFQNLTGNVCPISSGNIGSDDFDLFQGVFSTLYNIDYEYLAFLRRMEIVT